MAEITISTHCNLSSQISMNFPIDDSIPSHNFANIAISSESFDYFGDDPVGQDFIGVNQIKLSGVNASSARGVTRARFFHLKPSVHKFRARLKVTKILSIGFCLLPTIIIFALSLMSSQSQMIEFHRI